MLLSWSFSGELYQHYIDAGSKLAPERRTGKFSPCHNVYFLLVWKSDVPDLKYKGFHHFMVCDTCTDLNAKCLRRSIQEPIRAMYEAPKNYRIIVHGHWASLYTTNSVLSGGTNVTVEIMHQTVIKLL